MCYVQVHCAYQCHAGHEQWYSTRGTSLLISGVLAVGKLGELSVPQSTTNVYSIGNPKNAVTRSRLAVEATWMSIHESLCVRLPYLGSTFRQSGFS